MEQEDNEQEEEEQQVWCWVALWNKLKRWTQLWWHRDSLPDADSVVFKQVEDYDPHTTELLILSSNSYQGFV
jgi:hypothetical protein